MRGFPRLLLIGAVAVVAAVGWWQGAGDYLTAERFESLLRGAGVWGPVIYVLLFSLLEPFGVPGLVFVLPASLVWEWPTLFLLSWLGAVGAGVVGFGFARTIGRDWVAEHLPESARRFDERLASHGFTSVILVRLTFFLWPPAHWMLGLSRVDFAPFLLGTIVGFGPWMAAFTFVGQGALDFLLRQPGWLWALVLGVLVAGFVIPSMRARRSRMAAEGRERQ